MWKARSRGILPANDRRSAAEHIRRRDECSTGHQHKGGATDRESRKARPVRIAFNAAVVAHPLTGVARYAFELSGALRDLGAQIEHWTWDRLRPALRVKLGGDAGVWTFPALGGLGARILPGLRCILGRFDAWHFPNGDLLPCPVPRTAMIHDMGPFLLPDLYPPDLGAFYRERTRRVVEGCRAIMANSGTTLADLAEVFPECRERVFLTLLGADHAAPPPDARSALPAGLSPGYILSVGTIEPRKNTAALIRAYHRLVSSPAGRDAPLLVICGGPGYRSGEVTALPAELGIMDRVIFTGYVDEAVLSALYGSAGALAHPALYEGFGLPVVEALRRGLPVAASDNSSIRELFGGMFTPLDPRDVDSIAHALSTVLSGSGGAAKPDGRPQGLAGMTWRKCAEDTLAVFERLR